MKVNPALTALDNVKAIILELNPSMDLSAGKVSFGSVQAGSYTGGRNTRILVTAVQDAGYSGQQYVNYYRPTLAEAVVVPTVSFSINEGETAEQFTVRVLGLLGLVRSDITLSSGTTLPVPSLTTPDSAVTITALTGSRIYAPSTKNITVKLGTVTLTNLPTFMVQNTGWTNNATRGWYNNSNTDYWFKRYVDITAAVAAKVKQVGAVFSSNSLSPAGGVASNWIELIYTDDSIDQFGITNLNDAFGGQIIFQVNGTQTNMEGNIVDLSLLKTANAGKTLKQIAIISNVHTSGGATLRGMKNVRLIF